MNHHPSDPKRRPRTVEWLDKKTTWLCWHLERGHWQRMPPGTHHLFEETESACFLPRIPKVATLEEIKKIHEQYPRKVKRLQRYAKLHNRYLQQLCNLTGLIIN